MAPAQDSSGNLWEARRAPRKGAVKFIWFKVLGEEHEAIARSCDVSRTGIGLHTAEPIAPGKLVFVEVITASGAVSFVGRVAHCSATDDLQRVGIQVDTMPPNDRPAWEKLVHEGR